MVSAIGYCPNASPLQNLKILQLLRQTGPQTPYLVYISHLFSQPY